MKTIFGPVPSRRLGRSLGIDVIAPKTCSYNCVYCESGSTTVLTLKRQAFVSIEQVLGELSAYFEEYPSGADVLTFSSAGEPTLYEPLGALIHCIKEKYPHLPLIVLTNGSLFWDPMVRKGLMEADRVVPSLCAVTDEVFRKLHRPHGSLRIEEILEGLSTFRKEYRGRFHLEVMLVSGINDQPDELARVRTVVEGLQPDEVELNTIVRPPAVADVRGLSAERMENARLLFHGLNARIIGRFEGGTINGNVSRLEERILELVNRRPCSTSEMAASLGVSLGELEETLAKLEKEESLSRVQFNHIDFLCVRTPEEVRSSLEEVERSNKT